MLLIVPPDYELLSFFGVEPLIDELIHTFHVIDNDGTELTFSYDVGLRSVQTQIRHGGRESVLVSAEECNRILISDNVMKCVFTISGIALYCVVEVNPRIHVKWSLLVN